MQGHKVYILLALCVLFWSGNFVLGRFVKADIQPIELAFFRWTFVLLLILPSLIFLDIKKMFRICKENLLIMSVLAVLGISTYNTVLYLALQHTTATNALLINSMTPMIIVVYTFLILRTQISKIQIMGVCSSTLGVFYIVLKGDMSNFLSLEFSQGDLWIIVASNVWALYSVLLRYKPHGLKTIELFVCFVFIGYLFLLPVYLYQGYSLEREVSLLKEYWYFFLYISLCASILSYYFWSTGVETIGANAAGQFTHLMPIFGSILAYIFLNESLEMIHFIGAILIALGIYLGLFYKKHLHE